MAAVRGAELLQDELEKVKENLKGVDDNIKKLYGRDPTENRIQRRVFHDERGGHEIPANRNTAAGRLFGQARRIINNPNREAPSYAGRRLSQGDGMWTGGGIRSRLGPKRGRDSDEDEDEQPRKHSVMSSVVLSESKEVPKREDSIALKTMGSAGKERNRRMFGALLGTLQRFQNDSKKEVDKEKQRLAVERKLEEKQRAEQHELRRERAAAWGEKRAKQRTLRQIEHKMRLVKMFEDWERETRKMAFSIKTTKAKIYIFYRPKIMQPANEKALENTKEFIEEMIRKKKAVLEADIERLMAPSIKERTHQDDEHDSGDESSSSDEDDSEIEEGEVRRRKRRKRSTASADSAHSDIDNEARNGHGVKVEPGLEEVKTEKVDVKEEPVEMESTADFDAEEVRGEEKAALAEVSKKSQTLTRSRTASRSVSRSPDLSKKHKVGKSKKEIADSGSESSSVSGSGSESDSGSESGSSVSGSGSSSSSDSGSDDEQEQNNKESKRK